MMWKITVNKTRQRVKSKSGLGIGKKAVCDKPIVTDELMAECQKR